MQQFSHSVFLQVKRVVALRTGQAIFQAIPATFSRHRTPASSSLSLWTLRQPLLWAYKSRRAWPILRIPRRYFYPVCQSRRPRGETCFRRGARLSLTSSTQWWWVSINARIASWILLPVSEHFVKQEFLSWLIEPLRTLNCDLILCRNEIDYQLHPDFPGRWSHVATDHKAVLNDMRNVG